MSLFIGGDDAYDVWEEVAKDSVRFFSTLVIGLMFVALMWIIGFIWCCTRCCCGCGSGKKASSGDGFTMVIEAILLVILLVFGTLSMAWFFSANNFMFAGVEDLPNNLENVAFDLDLFLNNTAEELEHVAKVNFNEFKDQVKQDIDEAKDGFEQMVTDVTEKIEFQEMLNIAQFLNGTAYEYKEEQVKFASDLDTIGETVSDISSLITRFKGTIYPFCAVPTVDCSALDPILNNLDIDVTMIPDSSIVTGLTIPDDVFLQLGKLDQTLAEGLDSLTQLTTNFTDDKIKEIIKQLDEIGVTIDENVDDIIDSIATFHLLEDYRDVEPDIRDSLEYLDFVYYGFLAFGLILVGILFMYLVGIVLGTCGSVGGPTKTVGACCICSSSFIFFLLSSILWLLVTVFFTFGALSDHFVCKTLEDPSNSELGNWTDKYLQQLLNDTFSETDLGHYESDISISGIIESCQSGSSLYEVFDIEQIFNVQEEFGNWTEKYNITEAMNEIKDNLKTYLTDLGESIDLGNFEDSVNTMTNTLDQLQSEVIGQISGLDLNSLINQNVLNNINDTISGIDFGVQDITALFDQIQAMNSSVTKLFTEVDDANQTLIAFDTDYLHYNGLNLATTFEKAIQLVQDAKTDLTDPGEVQDLIFNEVDKVINSVIATGDEFVDYVLDYVQNKFANCSPLADVYDLTENTICYQFLNPFNGIWTGVGLYLILMLPILILSCALEPLFRRYSKPAYTKERHIEMTGNLINCFSIVFPSEIRTKTFFPSLADMMNPASAVRTSNRNHTVPIEYQERPPAYNVQYYKK